MQGADNSDFSMSQNAAYSDSAIRLFGSSVIDVTSPYEKMINGAQRE